MKICVYCASSSRSPAIYVDAAERLGRLIAERNWELIYGGGAVGLMGTVADNVLAAGGRVTGVIPAFMRELEWQHPEATEMLVVDDMHSRKSKMLELADAVIALPGGCGTLEEILEAITWRRLGLFNGPAIFINTAGFYDDMLSMLEKSVSENFMNEEHRQLWGSITEPEELPDFIDNFIPLDNPLSKAAVKS